jgi:hypothetical protein
MRRLIAPFLLCALLATPVLSVAGCASGNDANAAISSGSATLGDYNKLDQPVADLMTQIDGVQPNAADVAQGLTYVSKLDDLIKQRRDLAKKAREEFARVRTRPTDKKVIGYADHAVSLVGGLIGLDAALHKYAADQRTLFVEFTKNGSDPATILKVTGVIEADKITIAKQRKKVEALAKVADEYYQKNLATRK